MEAHKFRKYPMLERAISATRNTLTNDTTFTCIGCQQTWKNSKLERMKDHALSCRDIEADLKREIIDEMKMIDEAKSISAGAFRSPAQRDADKLLIEFIAVSSIPVRVICSEQFRQFLHRLQPNYKAPTKSKIRTELRKIFDRSQMTTINKLKSEASNTLTLEIDGWSGQNKMHLIALTLTCLNGRCYILDIIDSTDCINSSEMISNKILQCLSEINLPMKLFNAIITDQASNYQGARENIARFFKSKKLLIFEYRCLAHLLNLIGSHMTNSKAIEPAIAKLTGLANHINKSKNIISALKQQGFNKPRTPSKSRWYGYTESINSMLNLKNGLTLLANDDRLGDSKWADLVMDQRFWFDLKDLKPYFDKLASMIGDLERCDSTLSQALHLFLEFARFIMVEIEPDTRFRMRAEEAFLLHFFKSPIDLLLASYMLSPRYRMKYLTREAKNTGFQKIIEIYLDLGGRISDATVLERQFDIYETRLSSANLADDTYCYWEDSNLYELASIGKRLAACHASSANTERVFSTLARIATNRRARLSLPTIKRLLCISNNLETKEKSNSSCSQAQSSQNSSQNSLRIVEPELNSDSDSDSDYEFIETARNSLESRDVVDASDDDSDVSSELNQLYHHEVAPSWRKQKFDKLFNFNSIVEIDSSFNEETYERRSSSELAREYMSRRQS